MADRRSELVLLCFELVEGPLRPSLQKCDCWIVEGG